MTLRSAAVGPPIVLPALSTVMPVPFPSAAVPDEFVPIQLPATVLPVPLSIATPDCGKPLITKPRTSIASPASTSPFDSDRFDPSSVIRGVPSKFPSPWVVASITTASVTAGSEVSGAIVLASSGSMSKWIASAPG